MICVSCKSGQYVRRGNRIECDVCGDLWGDIGHCARCGRACTLAFGFCEACCNIVWDEWEAAGRPGAGVADCMLNWFLEREGKK